MIERIKEFLKEVRMELKKVVFPTKQELVGATRVVLVAVFAIALYLWVVDLLLVWGVRFILR